MKHIRLAFLSGPLLVSVGLGVMLAGATADLKGKITDKQGHPLPGVTLTLRNDTVPLAERGVVTDADGAYLFRDLPPAPGYRLRAEGLRLGLPGSLQPPEQRHAPGGGDAVDPAAGLAVSRRHHECPARVRRAVGGRDFGRRFQVGFQVDF